VAPLDLPEQWRRTYPADLGRPPSPPAVADPISGQEHGMRSIWRGAVSFGLVSIGVKLYTATEDHDIRFNQVHAVDGGRIKYRRVCSIDGEEVEYSEIAKGYELPDGQLVVLTDEDFEELPLASRREIEVLQFVDQDEIDPIQYEKTYYLEPDPSATRPYVLLRDALENAGRVAITKISIRSRESLAALRVKDGVMVLHTMRWPDEIRRPDFAFLDEDVAVRPQELQMAEALIGSMTGEFDPTEFTDDYREAMAELLEAKQSGGEVQPLPETADSGAAVVDLMSALRRSVEAARGGAPAEETPARRAPAKKVTAARKAAPTADEAPSRRTAARKATAAAKPTPAKKATAAGKKATAEKAPAKRTRRSA
jgi:DNA end-binding protein Ku